MLTVVVLQAALVANRVPAFARGAIGVFALSQDVTMTRSRFSKGVVVSALVLSCGLFALAGLALAQTAMHRNSFETRIGWTKGGTDAGFDEITHRIDDRDPRTGQGAELIELDAKPGSFIHYAYPIGKAPIADEFRAAVWVKANRPGLQFIARVVLPNERDPKNLDYRLTTYIRGDTYQQTGRWQLLEIGRPVTLAKQQQHLMNAEFKRNFDFSGAYIDTLVLNVYGGPGATKLWIDDLEVGPVLPGEPFQTADRVDNNFPAKIASTSRPGGAERSVVKFDSNRLVVGKKRVLFRAIRYTDTMLPVLRSAGFNTICFERNVTPALLTEAADMGLWIVPEFRVMNDDGTPVSPDDIVKQVRPFADNDAVLFSRIGGVLSFDQMSLVSKAVQAARGADPGRLIAADVWDGLVPYSRSVNLIGTHRFPLMTTLELPKYREWLETRRKLALPDSFTWTWIQTHLPDWYSELLYNQPAQAEFKEPVGPQPEQIRLLTYTALASGARGIGFWSDRFLADSHQGRDRLLGCALLNQEIDMIESLLVTVEDPPQWIDTSVKDVKAAVLRCRQGVVVLPIWQGKFSQFVPGQAAVAKLTLMIPQVPVTSQAWEVSPGEVRGLKTERADKGLRVTLPEFGLTSILVFTSDVQLMSRFQDLARARRQQAAQWSHDMALYEYEKVVKVQTQLEQLNVSLPDANSLLEDSRRRLQKSKELYDRSSFAEAYHEANRALRPVRILMRAHWENAVRGLDTPVASPFAVSFYTLPKHWQFIDLAKRSTAGANLLRGGDFEIAPERIQDAWKLDRPTMDDMDMSAERVGELSDVKKPKSKGDNQSIEGRQCLMLKIAPRQGKPVPPGLERTMLALTSPAVKLPPGTLVQVSGWVNIPEPIVASVDGALMYDSAGGEPLAIRMTDATSWKKFTVYRRMPATGSINVTLAMTGIGTVYFDDIRIEPLTPPNAPVNGNAQK